MKCAIIIPARYASTRFPGKPLVKIGGKTMLERVVELGQSAIEGRKDISLLVATEDDRILKFCTERDINCYLTSDTCLTGSDRVLEAAEKTGEHFDHLISLQGDAPFTPKDAITSILDTLETAPETKVITPVIQLRFEELDQLRLTKKTTPFSGTTAIIDSYGKAVWFSKNIIPAIRNENELRDADNFSPVYQHIGLYGYQTEVLQKFVKWPQGHYEKLEGLEQLRFLENNIPIQTVTISVNAGLIQSGIDSPEDVERAEKLIMQHGNSAA